MSALVRELLAQSLTGRSRRRRLTVEDFPFIGVGRSRQSPLSPVSERHDEAVAEVLSGKTGRR